MSVGFWIVALFMATTALTHVDDQAAGHVRVGYVAAALAALAFVLAAVAYVVEEVKGPGPTRHEENDG